MNNNPLEINLTQAKQTDFLIKEYQTNGVINKYNSYDMPISFKEQPTGIQTVIISISFQYGANSDSLLKMWEALKNNDINELILFFEGKIQNSKYSDRRKLELEYLQANLK